MPVNNFQALQMCALRVTRLDAAGAPVSGPNNAFVTDSLTELTLEPEFADGQTIELLNACGCLCASFTDPDKLKNFTLELTLCSHQVPLVELLTGATAIIDPAGPTLIGYNVKSATDCGASVSDGVAIEGWAKAWDGDGAAAENPYVRILLPRVKWTPGGATFSGEDFWTPTFTGVSSSNAAWTDIYGDWGTATGIDPSQPMSVWQTDTIPTLTPETPDYTPVPAPAPIP